MTAILHYLRVQDIWSASYSLLRGFLTSSAVLSGDSATNPLSHAGRLHSTTELNLSPILLLNEDVFTLIAVELLRNGHGSLSALSLCCWQLRRFSFHTLFARCTAMKGEGKSSEIPPFAIRPFVRYLTYNWSLYYPRKLESDVVDSDFHTPLLYLPHVHSLTFDCDSPGIPWEAISHCLSVPQVKSISFTGSAIFTYLPSLPNDAGSIYSVLEDFHYPTPLLHASSLAGRGSPSLAEYLEPERAFLSALLLGINSTARSLILPMKTTPLEIMAAVEWPSLQNLFLGGCITTDPSLTQHLHGMLLRMPNLRHLSIAAALPDHTGFRCCLLAHNRSSHSPSSGLQRLQSLVITYPDPADPLFSIPLSELTHLSLRDWPRHYTVISPSAWRSPILSASEALSILQRVRAPALLTLELVYSADDADDDVLTFVSQRFPKLRHLQLHRYRKSPEETVDHRHIARTLSAISTLATLRLNLDLKDDTTKRFRSADASRASRGRLESVGWDILDAMAACPPLGGVALLHRATSPGLWIWFLRSRHAARAPVYDLSDDNRDTLSSAFPLCIGRKLMYY